MTKNNNFGSKLSTLIKTIKLGLKSKNLSYDDKSKSYKEFKK